MKLSKQAPDGAGGAGAAQTPHIRPRAADPVSAGFLPARKGVCENKPTSAGRASLMARRGDEAKVCSLNPPEEPQVESMCVWVVVRKGR